MMVNARRTTPARPIPFARETRTAAQQQEWKEHFMARVIFNDRTDYFKSVWKPFQRAFLRVTIELKTR
jgi:hypothetical protein